MGRLRYFTAGESHGEKLVGILDGMPAGLSLIAERDIDPILRDRQKGYGRSRRQQIEDDKAKIISGVRFGVTTGAPISILIENNDWKNWSEKMAVAGEAPDDLQRVTIPRPGHVDYAGGIKYGHTDDLRNAFERASARETAMRVALGAIANTLLKELRIISISYVRSIGRVTSEISIPTIARRRRYSEEDEMLLFRESLTLSQLRTPDAEAEKKMIALIDEAKENGDTLGGVVETIFYRLPVGIGSHVQWDRKLDGLIAQAAMSIQAVKSVEIGGGRKLAGEFGSASHDGFIVDGASVRHSSNNSGGIEGGISNGEPIIVRAAMKPISTLMQPLPSFDFATGKPTKAHIERSDICAVPSLSVIVENVVALALADALLNTYGGDTVIEVSERII